MAEEKCAPSAGFERAICRTHKRSVWTCLLFEQRRAQSAEQRVVELIHLLDYLRTNPIAGRHP